MAADPLTISRCNRASSNRVPTNQKKSGGSKKRGTRNYSDRHDKRELLLAEPHQQYARVTKRLGDGRFELQCFGDGQSRLGHVRGKLWKRVWVVPHDLVLVSLRTFQDQKVDIVHKFTGDEERHLCRMAEIPQSALVDDDKAHELGLQTVRDVHGSARAGFLPTEDDFGFSEDA